MPVREDFVKELSKNEEWALQRRAIMRANRLGRLIELEAPLIIIETEWRSLEEAMMALRLKRGYDHEQLLAQHEAEQAQIQAELDADPVKKAAFEKDVQELMGDASQVNHGDKTKN